MLCPLKKTDQLESIIFSEDIRSYIVIIKTFYYIKVLFPPFCRNSFPGGGGCKVFVHNQLIFDMRLCIEDFYSSFA